MPRILAVVLSGLLALSLLCGCVEGPVAPWPPSRQPTEIDPGILLPSPFPSARPSSNSSPTPGATPPIPTAAGIGMPTPKGPLVAIDPGHGGEDLGACHVDTRGRLLVTESELNLAIALLLRDELEARGIRVLLTRTGDYALNADEVDVNADGVVDYRDELQARVDLVNEQGAELLLSIHQNAYERSPGVPARDVGGTITYYCAARPFAEENLRFARTVHRAVVDALAEVGYKTQDRGVRSDEELSASNPAEHLILLGPESPRIARPSQMVGVLSEALFVSHDEEVRLLMNPDVQARLARAYADAIVEYLGAASPQDG